MGIASYVRLEGSVESKHMANRLPWSNDIFTEMPGSIGIHLLLGIHPICFETSPLYMHIHDIKHTGTYPYLQVVLDWNQDPCWSMLMYANSVSISLYTDSSLYSSISSSISSSIWKFCSTWAILMTHIWWSGTMSEAQPWVWGDGEMMWCMIWTSSLVLSFSTFTPPTKMEVQHEPIAKELFYLRWGNMSANWVNWRNLF